MWEAEQVFVGHGAPVYCCAWDGAMVYSAAGDKFITRWSIETGKQDNFAIRLDVPAYTIAVFQGKLFAGLTNGTLICIDLASRELLWEKNFFGNPWFCIEFTAISDFMIAGDSEGNLLVLNLLGEKQLHLTLATGKIRSILSFGNTFVVASQDGTLRWFELPTFNELFTLNLSEQSIHSVCYIAKNDQLICGGKDGYLRVVSNETKKIIQAFPAHYQAIYGVNRIGSQVVTVSMDKTIKLWNSESWNIEQRIERPVSGHLRSVNGTLAIDERHFITWSDDKTSIYWGNKNARPAVEN